MKIQKFVYQRLVLLLASLMLAACGRPEFTDATGKHFDWHDYKGDWLVLNYWAEWCAPCLEEIPELNQLHAQAGQRVLGVNFDRPELPELRRQIESLGVQFPVVYRETNQRLKNLTPQVLPTTYVFDKNGALLATLVGPQTQQTITDVMEKGE